MDPSDENKVTTLEELKLLKNKLQIRRDRFGRRDKDTINESESSFFRNATLSAGFKNEHFSQVGPSSTSSTRTSSSESSSKEPSNIEYEKLVRDYFTNNLHSKCTFPIETYELLKRLATWQSVRAIPFTKTSLYNLEKALRTLSNIWGPNVMLIKEKQIGKSKKLVIEKVDIEKLGVINVFESSLESDDPSMLDKSLQLTTSVNGNKKRKIEDLTDDTALKEINELLDKPSFKEVEENKSLYDLCIMLDKKSSKDKLIIEMFRSTNNSFREFCVYGTKVDCRKQRRTNRACHRLHFRPMLRSHTELDLGDCSYLNTCHRMDTCKYVHYELDDDEERWTYEKRRQIPPAVFTPPKKVLPPQWINCDVRKFEFSILGKFTVIMADPPWDIHMTLPYGTMTDDEMKAMAISDLQDDGLIFLWVTGRAMELGRECLAIWGYDRADELVWIKTNQLQRLIRTGRTGHWLNHSKEHCLVGIKGNPEGLNWGLDCDVLVGEVRETSRKPDEVYGLIDRLAPGKRKLEIFGRQHNTRPGWMTLGNQLDDVRLYESDVFERFNERYPEKPCRLTQLPADY
ncbi:5964_t:CDS:10 [Funneliformis caledonium]|uniref:mRNA m(6)A methyltransferase n=1 Tax=Funneliformis caledonium TaxID=1117310 RepID=A0A9N9CT48_9GLOM|nr:5964_t:CDS:10 [Funneliformis caledonium]